ncbi:phosphodiester glycosidase family protein [Sphingobacterium sp. ML3W]|uniref:phosphodiester glycosidase family protein n=1 Tax=Sphingobacterium sp. ML3W TaxID=1538644 RepID=UPI00249CDF86|nr:phosphodiester glycosidase family protein [Sphingobacterium sp. ML3W]WFA78616.1 phosphodiester glycosidase family protein [Sphingobacterium sp. ML3W]
MKKNILYCRIKMSLMFVLFLISFVSCKKRDDYPKFDDKKEELVPEDVIPPDNKIEQITQRIIDQADVVKVFQMDSTIQLADGLTRTHIRFLNKLNQPTSIQILEIDLNKKIVPYVMSSFDDHLYVAQPISDMAKYNEVSSGGEVLAAINGASATTFSYIKNGRKINISTTSGKQKTQPFFAVQFDGKPYIGNCFDTVQFEFEPYDVNRFKGLISGTEWLQYRGAVIKSTSAVVQANTALGLSSNKSTLYAVVVDGINSSFSVGITFNDLAWVMKAIGAYDAFVVNSGGTSVMTQRKLSQDPNGQTVWDVVNKPPLNMVNTINGIGFVKTK